MIPAGTYADHYGSHDLTRPVVAVTLAEKVAAVERFCLDDEVALAGWEVIVDPELDGIVIRWNYLRLTVGERGDLELARYIAAERTRARQALDESVVLARRALGWGRGEPTVRCVVCRTTDLVSRQHRPGSRECRDTLEDRRHAHAG